MPKRVDHQERRREIAEALFRIAAAQGLQAVTLRAVAAEAGISMNLVQYYFPTKEEMLRFSWQRIVELTAEHAGKTIGEAMKTGDERTIVRAYLTAVLPDDERARMLSAVQIAYFAVDVTRGSQDPDQEPLLPHLVHAITELLRAAQEKGDVSAHLDPRLEADSLATMSAGLVTAIMVDAYTAERASEIVDYRLDGVFSGAR
ncbi:TetR/AcrR family transcriptional regulator [Amycolatopsis keratiniphila]|uniref:TetR family transcriptional regulator n=1 Tax=Amycolatopsis keratiniphila TaxID=129921 RepID=R4SU21_9PSEU|nr:MULTISPECIES: TetR/AcrR family transcriptional regulator [Amycolatopsis]AGM06045.1 TetR family transcriptional regulator [Amycolatopsis keratiniphila]OLZ49801.1 TetR family transcriptional regulator [Amycolatopsis keratiniphila subsp. nogabecina]RSN28981.1 TetR/AcrR family transcriptional regulator [Amycolatopsis sp. WAC 04169]SDU24339.1 DNA-binding transcriptional regulator, AcrR family [Amycolatopsis keratiniphila]